MHSFSSIFHVYKYKIECDQNCFLPTASRYGSILQGTPHFLADKYRTSAFLPRDAHHLSSSSSSLAKYEDEARHQRLFQDKERDRHLMHQQVGMMHRVPQAAGTGRAEPKVLHREMGMSLLNALEVPYHWSSKNVNGFRHKTKR